MTDNIKRYMDLEKAYFDWAEDDNIEEMGLGDELCEDMRLAWEKLTEEEKKEIKEAFGSNY